MRKPLKLKKIKISRVDNLHTILAGALPAQGAHQADRITDYDMCGDTKLDGDCAPKTNSGRTGQTGVAYAEPVNSGIQN